MNSPRPVLLPATLRVRLGEADDKKLRSAAQSAGTTNSEIIRQILANARFVPVEPLRVALRELNYIGVNLNQIARHANRTGQAGDITNTLAAVRECCAELRKCLN